MIGLMILLVASIIGAALASAVEVASFAISHERLQEIAGSKGLRSRALLKLRSQPLHLHAAAWALRMAATVAAGISVWELARGAGWGIGLGLAAVVAVVAVIVLLQILARVSSLRVAEALALTAAPLLWLASIPVWLISAPAKTLVGFVAPEAIDVLPRVTDREIRSMLGQANGEPAIEEHELHLIRRAFLLDETTAYDAMTPRVDIFAWPESRPLTEIASELRTVRYSRVPLYRDSIDRITGILYIREAYQALVSGRREVRLRALAREPLLVPGSMTLDKLLPTFQTRRIHMGIVIDEYGGTDGLITLEDILEELVGEITDETDIAEEPIIRLGRNEILVDGGADLREINYFLNTAFPLLEHRSLNGYLLEAIGRVPEEGETLVRDGVSISVIEATDTQVVRVKLTRLPNVEEGEPSGSEDSGVAPATGGELEGAPSTARSDGP